MSIWDTPITDSVLDDNQKAEEVVFIGQDEIKRQVEPFLHGEKFPHLLLTGDPGLGKTQFAKWIAYKREKPFYERLAPVRPDSLPPYGIMLLDEVHRHKFPEDLFKVMSEGILSIIATTTKPEKLDAAFDSRFLLKLRLRRYHDEEMVQIMRHMIGLEGKMSGNKQSHDIEVLAHAASGHPRTAERIAFTAKGLGTTDPEDVLKACRITADGLNQDHIEFLAYMDAHKRPVGLQQIQGRLDITKDAISQVESDLMERGLIELSYAGRRLTTRGEQYVVLLEREGLV